MLAQDRVLCCTCVLFVLNMSSCSRYGRYVPVKDILATAMDVCQPGNLLATSEEAADALYWRQHTLARVAFRLYQR
jgi:hypothetical protein